MSRSLAPCFQSASISWCTDRASVVPGIGDVGGRRRAPSAHAPALGSPGMPTRPRQHPANGDPLRCAERGDRSAPQSAVPGYRRSATRVRPGSPRRSLQARRAGRSPSPRASKSTFAHRSKLLLPAASTPCQVSCGAASGPSGRRCPDRPGRPVRAAKMHWRWCCSGSILAAIYPNIDTAPAVTNAPIHERTLSQAAAVRKSTGLAQPHGRSLAAMMRATSGAG